MRRPGNDGGARAAQRRREEGRRHGHELDRGPLGGLHPGLGGRRHDPGRRVGRAVAGEARGDDQRLLGRAGHDRHPRRHAGGDDRRHHRRRGGHRRDQREDDCRAAAARHRQEGRGTALVRRTARRGAGHGSQHLGRLGLRPPRRPVPGAAGQSEELTDRYRTEIRCGGAGHEERRGRR